MNACFIYYQQFGSLLHREACALKEKGFEIDIICLRKNRNDEIKRIVDGIKIYQIQARPRAEKKAALYFFNIMVFLSKSLFLVNLLFLIRRYQVIHCTSPPDIIVFTAILPKLFGSKILLDIHDIGPELYMRKLSESGNSIIIRTLKHLEKISCQFSDHVITVTDLWKDKLVSRSVSSSNCSVILNVPDENIFCIKREDFCVSHSNKFNIFYHGSLEEHFGVDILLDAMLKIRKDVPNILLNIYGGRKGRLYVEFSRFVEKNGMQTYVKFHEFVPFYKLPKILASADLGIVPTKGGTFSDEAVSMKSLEYIFLGIPIVISKTKAHSFYYDSSMVEFFEPENSQDLANSVIKLIQLPERRKSMIQNSCNFIKSNSWNEIIKKKYTFIVDSLTNCPHTRGNH